jgi:glycosyltransferase involved in cell wall biosynthesis
MRVLGLTNLYPNPMQPHRAPFNRHLFRLLAERHAVRLIAPVAWTDELSARRRGADPLPPERRVTTDGLTVEHPRYYFPPRLMRGWYGHCYQASVRGAFRRAVAGFRPDVVHAPWAYPDGWAAVRLAHAAGLPVTIQVHGSDVRLLDRYPARRRRTVEALRAADGVIAVSRELADTIVGLGVDPDRVVVRHDGIDPELFRPASGSAARDRLGMDRTTRRLLFIGNLVEVKGIDVLLDACHRLRHRGLDFEADLVGHGPLRGALERQARRLGLGNVHFRGPLPQAELPDWYRAADVFVLPSRSEGVPNVLLEAMACRTPFVASRVGGIPEVAVAGLSRLVPPDDPAALAEAVAAELTAPPRDPDRWPAPRLRTEAVAEVAEFLESVVARRAGLSPVGA